jgi:hypothetical protein
MSRAMLARKAEAAPAAPLQTAVKNPSGALRIGEPDDAFEREADRVADAIMASDRLGATWSLSRMTIIPPLQRQRACGVGCEEHEAEKTLQREVTGRSSPDAALPAVHEALRSPGRQLDHETRIFMESRFRHDFGNVRIFTDDTAALSAQAVAAIAYTVGEKIVFNRGQYSPDSDRGCRLLAHELTHVLQQVAGVSGVPASGPTEETGDALEAEANRASVRASDAAQEKLGGTPPGSDMFGPRTSTHRTLPPESGLALGATNLTVARQPLRIFGRAPSNLIQRQPIPVPGSQAPLAGPHTGMQPFPAPPPVPLAWELHELIKRATWKEIRKQTYPKESAAGIQRAKQRKSGALPDLTGLGSIKSLGQFATAMHDVQKNWGKTTHERLKSVGKAANVQLVAAEVPEFKTVDKEKMTPKAYFAQSEWGFRVNEELVNQNSLNDADAGDLANTTLHESRHAEQAFLAARYAASVLKQNATTIATTQSIPGGIAKEAVGKKFDAATDPSVAALGAQMFDANVTHGTSNQAISDAVTASITKLDAARLDAETAVKALDASETPKTIADARVARDALRSQIASVEQSYKGYRNIPYEADAHEVGDAEEQAFKGWP